MGFEKGHNKIGGREKGTQNKVSATFREKVLMLLENQYPQIEKDLKALSPQDRVEIWIKLIEFAIPKLQRSEATIETIDTDTVNAQEKKKNLLDGLDRETKMEIMKIILEAKHNYKYEGRALPAEGEFSFLDLDLEDKKKVAKILLNAKDEVKE